MADVFEIPNLQTSDSEEVESSDSESDSEPVATKGRGLAKPYDIVPNFQTEQLFKQWWETVKSGWTLQTTLQNKNQMVRVWWCKHNDQYGGHVGQKCQIRLRVCYSREDTSVHAEQIRVDHDHAAAKTLDKIPDDLRARINQLTTEGVKPKRIHTLFTEGMDPIPDLKQIQYFVCNQRSPASKPFTDHQLRSYCEEHSAVPDDPNKMYELEYEVNGPDSFFVMWTTPRLLERQLSSKQTQDTLGQQRAQQLARGHDHQLRNTNGLESKNKRIKTDFLTRTMQAFEPFLQNVGAILSYWSIHLRARPNVPDILLAEMKKALELVAECTVPPGGTPRRYYLRPAGTDTCVFASSEARFANVGELYEAYQRNLVAGPATWKQYAEWRFEVHQVYPSTKFNERFYECSCQKGCKKNVCKHAVMVTCTLENIYEYSAEDLAKTMKHSRRSNAKQVGRPALSQKQNRLAAAD